jgi:hypothetical protein
MFGPAHKFSKRLFYRLRNGLTISMYRMQSVEMGLFKILTGTLDDHIKLVDFREKRK